MSETRIPKFVSYPLIALVAVVAVWLGVWLSLQNTDRGIPEEMEATVLPEARQLQPFDLQDHHGRPFGLEQLEGQWSFLFFGFTNCPDICPATLHTMKSVWQKLPTEPGEPGHPQLFFVSVDPDRDSLDTLKQYVTYFDPSFVGVTGDLDEIDNLTGQVGVLYGYDDNKNDNPLDYTVNHSGQVLLIDPRGRMRAVLSPPHDSTTMARNYQTIINYYGD
ncbi:MAG: SCO family protein [Thiohalophilus sp.]